MDALYLVKGVVIGLSIAAPVGPIGVLCIRRTLAQGKLVGLVSGLGAATADAIYGLIAAYGLTTISNFLVGQQYWLQLIGGLFLCYLGIKTLKAKSTYSSEHTQRKSVLSAYLSILFLTLTNPMTILSIIAIFSGLGLSISQSSEGTAFVLVLGVFGGSTLWWILLSSFVGLFQHKMTGTSLSIINRISGGIILLFGGFALYRLF
ncbi:LysE family transporter [Bacillus sp. RG28]|uniref:LysE family transporter n=1 Tax=Gottfriedia endophytica TaxID=2820819 RepID=A0A940NPA2_9BACI|nr:LysE family transporter [Gottfriedia endophytica]MBP0726291.1 LysE family transporter [Gottfriedia endophytica]